MSSVERQNDLAEERIRSGIRCAAGSTPIGHNKEANRRELVFISHN